jgi:hypothetical protein
MAVMNGNIVADSTTIFATISATGGVSICLNPNLQSGGLDRVRTTVQLSTSTRELLMRFIDFVF